MGVSLRQPQSLSRCETSQANAFRTLLSYSAVDVEEDDVKETDEEEEDEVIVTALLLVELSDDVVKVAAKTRTGNK